MYLARRAHLFQQAERSHLAIDGDRNVGTQAALVEEAVAKPWIRAFQILNQLPYRRTLRLNRRSPAGERLQQSRNINRRQAQSRWLQMAAMMAGGFMGRRRMRTPAAR